MSYLSVCRTQYTMMDQMPDSMTACGMLSTMVGTANAQAG